jgi:hypothetical protein
MVLLGTQRAEGIQPTASEVREDTMNTNATATVSVDPREFEFPGGHEGVEIVAATPTRVAYIHWDELPESPLEGLNFATIAAKHPRYELSTPNGAADELKDWLESEGEDDFAFAEDLLLAQIEGHVFYTVPGCEGVEETILEKATRYVTQAFGATVVLPLYLYDHSGLRVNTTGFHCPWDSGLAGFVFDTAESRRELGLEDIDTDTTRTFLEGEVSTFDDYLSGQVYAVTVASHEGGVVDDDSADTVWGFYGYANSVDAAHAEFKAVTGVDARQQVA